jgi:subtilisin family serine protease
MNYLRAAWSMALNLSFGNQPNLSLRRARFALVLITCGLIGAGETSLLAQLAAPNQPRGAYREGQILIRQRKHKGVSTMSVPPGHRISRNFAHVDVQVVKLPAGVKVLDAIEKYRGSGQVHFAEPDYFVEGSVIPNDPFFGGNVLWGLNDVSQDGVKVSADIDAPEAWDALNSAPNIVVAVIDTGVRYSHEDLAANMWTNPGEIPGNGLDDDGNGIVDDVHGLNAKTGSGDPMDDHGHGTHVAGIIGAAGDNGKGVVGVAWKVQIMACKFLDSANKGTISDAIECIQYARSKGAHIINASWSIPSHSTALQSAISQARDAGIIFVTAAGNEALNIDVTPRYPASYDLDNIVVVAATTRTHELDRIISNYGAATVDLGAPGVSIYSTWGSSDTSYQYLTGTSMAAPYVSGALALMRTRYPNENYQQILARLLAATDPVPSLADKTVSGGCVNLRKALGVPESTSVARPATTIEISRTVPGGELQVKLKGEPGRIYTLQASADLASWTSVYTNAAAQDGSMVFTDWAAGYFPQRYYRGVSVP